MKNATRMPSLEAPESRDKILESAEGLFAYGGYAGVGMRQLAALVGLSKSSLFHHFPTKLELYAAVLDREVERIEHALDRVALDGGSPVAQLEAWIDAIVTTLAEHVPAGRLLMRALVDEEPFPAIRVGALTAGAAGAAAPEPGAERERLAFEARLDAVLARFAGLLERGIAEGAFRPVPIADALLNVIGATVFYFASGDLGEAMIGESIFSAPAVERRRREVTEFVRRGLVA